MSFIKSLISPRRYVQGPGAFENAGRLIKLYGKKALVVGGKRALAGVEKWGLLKSLDKYGIAYIKEPFGQPPYGAECTKREIDRLVKVVEQNKCDTVITCGGGKAIDTGKAVAFKTNAAMIVIPTITATDAPTSALSVLYNEDHTFAEYLFYPRNPDLVLIDSKCVADAPSRFLACGMGDGFSKKYEGEAVVRAGKTNFAWVEFTPTGANYAAGADHSTITALTLCRLGNELMLKYGLPAILACKNHIVTPALEAIIEANVLLSGLGFESTGLAAAHSIYDGLTAIIGEPEMFHGEGVHFGTLTQMVMEDRPTEEIMNVMEWSHSVGLPTTFADIGLKNVTDEQLWKVAQKATAPGETIHNMYFPVTPEIVFNAMKAVDALGKTVKTPKLPLEAH